MKKFLALLLALLIALSFSPAVAEKEYLFDAWPDIWESQINDGVFADLIRVDLYARLIFHKSELDVYVSTPYDVAYIQDVLLTDGLTICKATIQIIEYTEIYITFPCEPIREFVTYKGLYLIFIWKIPE